MDKKIKILFYNVDGAGVNYYRTTTPANELERNHSNEFHVEISNNIDFNDPDTLDYLKSFDIIHYHRQLVGDMNMFYKIVDELKKSGTKLIVDVDDYWHLPKQHPYYNMSVERQLHKPIIENLKLADYVTTTTDIFANEISKTSNKNIDDIGVFYNSIDPSWMKQFQNNWKPDPDGKVRITYMAGSSHKGDVEQLRTVVNVLNADTQLKGKFKIILAGWDADGTTVDVTFNQEFGAVLQSQGLWNNKIIKIINDTRGNVDAIPQLSEDIKNQFRGKVFKTDKRQIKSDESVYYYYENILTDHHRIINDDDYVQWLMNFERDGKYENEGIFARRWTQKANAYASVLDETDIVIAPLTDNTFNRMKSNLKQVECWTRKLPIVCSDMPPYNVDGEHMRNCMLVPTGKQAHKYWKKHLKKLILDDELRTKLGENLYNDFKEKYHLKNVTENRAKFYKSVLKK
ncbi:MAG: hypothetical protein ACOC2W_01710 [bacterium]